MKKYFIVAISVALIATALIASAVFADDTPGSSQYNPAPVTGLWETIPANAWRWYYFDYNADRDKIHSRIEAWVDNNLNAASQFELARNVDLAIYTPEQVQDFKRDPGIAPVGRGTKPPEGLGISGHDLYWAGTFNYNGRFMAVVKNNNPVPLQYRLWVQGNTVTRYPVPTPTPLIPFLDNPLATPIPTGDISGRILLRENSGGNIYTVNGDGFNMKRIGYGLDPAWSPDGTRIAFTRWDEPSGVYVANADASNPVRVWIGRQITSPRWSPDSKRIAFSQFKVSRPVFGSTRIVDDIWKIGIIELEKAIDGDTTKTVLTEPNCTNHCFAPSWNPDGRYLVYADGAVGVMNTDTTTNTVWTMYNQTIKVQSTSYSPDGTKVAFQLAQHDHWEISVLNLADGIETRLTSPDPLSFRVVDNVAPTWSPDSKEILFLSNRRGKWEFFAVNIDGTNLRQVLKAVTDQLTIQYYFVNERVADWIR